MWQDETDKRGQTKIKACLCLTAVTPWVARSRVSMHVSSPWSTLHPHPSSLFPSFLLPPSPSATTPRQFSPASSLPVVVTSAHPRSTIDLLILSTLPRSMPPLGESPSATTLPQQQPPGLSQFPAFTFPPPPARPGHVVLNRFVLYETKTVGAFSIFPRRTAFDMSSDRVPLSFSLGQQKYSGFLSSAPMPLQEHGSGCSKSTEQHPQTSQA